MWIGYAKAGREFEVEADINAIGITATVARKVVAIRKGKQRWPEAEVTPYLTNYVFIDVDAERYLELRAIKHLSSTMLAVPRSSEPSVRAFLTRLAERFAATQAEIEAGKRVSEYAVGDAMEIVDGPLRGHLARFRAIVENAHDPFPRIRADVEVMGRMATVDVDPIAARRAG